MIKLCCFCRASQGQWAPRGTPGPQACRDSQDCRAAKVTRARGGHRGSQDQKEMWYDDFSCSLHFCDGQWVSRPTVSLSAFLTGSKRRFRIPWCRRNSRKCFVRFCRILKHRTHAKQAPDLQKHFYLGLLFGLRNEVGLSVHPFSPGVPSNTAQIGSFVNVLLCLASESRLLGENRTWFCNGRLAR